MEKTFYVLEYARIHDAWRLFGMPVFRSSVLQTKLRKPTGDLTHLEVCVKIERVAVVNRYRYH